MKTLQRKGEKGKRKLTEKIRIRKKRGVNTGIKIFTAVTYKQIKEVQGT